MIRSTLAVTAAVLVMTGCSDDPTTPGVGERYDLVQVGSATVPIGYFPYDSVDSQQRTMVCVDTLQSQTILLRKDASATLGERLKTSCAGRAPTTVSNTIPGTWTATADSLTLTWSGTGPTGPMTWSWHTAREGSDLVIRWPVYTEDDQDGTGASQFILRYRRRR